MPAVRRALRLFTILMGIALGISVLLVGLINAAGTENRPASTTQSLSDRAIERRAVEAVIWGMPAVNYDLMLQEM